MNRNEWDIGPDLDSMRIPDDTGVIFKWPTGSTEPEQRHLWEIVTNAIQVDCCWVKDGIEADFNNDEYEELCQICEDAVSIIQGGVTDCE